jgi:hypothetical protein
MAITLDGTSGVTTPAESVTGEGVWSVGGSHIYKHSNGNVGIGTSLPNSTLNIVGPQTVFDGPVIGQVLVRSTAAFNATPRAGIAFSVKFNSAGNYTTGGSSIQGYKQTTADGEFANGLLFTTQAEGSAPAERMRIDSAGRVTMPYQPLATLHQTATRQGPFATYTKMTAFSPIINTGNHWDNVNQRFVCPVTGVYQVVMQGIKYPQQGPLHIDPAVNGSALGVYRVRAEEASGYNQFSVTNFLPLAAGDYIEFFHFGDAGIHADHGAFSIKLVG